MATTTTAELYRRPNLPTITYAVGLLLFLLPFFDIKCNNVTMAQLKGIDVAFGGKPSVNRDLESMQNGFGSRGFDDNNVQAARPQGEGHLFITALIAFVLGVIGLILSLLNKGRNQRPNMIIGIAGAVALIASWIQVSAYVNSNAKPHENPDADFSGMVNISASPTFWFILCLICFAVAAYYSYKQSQRQALGEMPTAAAPQLPIDNPGEQSEFPAAPHNERDLG